VKSVNSRSALLHENQWVMTCVVAVWVTLQNPVTVTLSRTAALLLHHGLVRYYALIVTYTRLMLVPPIGGRNFGEV
jgi:hypothetical protein